ncbi:MAG: PLP-dependent aminotransferase family protein [Bacillota bacterium]
MSVNFSKKSSKVKASEIREMLKITESPDIISFAGGLPAPESFPVEEIREICTEVLSTQGAKALQYGTTEGYAPLRRQIAEMLCSKGINVQAADILITSGSQQGLDLTGKVFIDEGDIVICESPTYLAAINAFRAYMPDFVEINMDDDGMIMEELERAITDNPAAKFIYTIPDFQNPSGRTMSLERRQKLIELAVKYDMLIIEDNPYGELVFEGEGIAPVKSLDECGRVIYMGTFSKILSPGMRIGFVCAAQEILNKYILFKQSTDLHTSTFSQIIASAYMEKYDIKKHIRKIIDMYSSRCSLMYETAKKELPDYVRISRPNGGLFLWAELPEHINTRVLLKKCLEQKVAFVPGGSFFPNGGRENTMRLNFSNMKEEMIIEGIKRLAKVLKDI